MNKISIGFIFSVLLLTSVDVQAQSRKKIKAAYKSNPPKVVLVELFTYTNKINYYKRTQQDKKADQLEKDARKIMERTIKDFNTNFKFSPIYYFYDTNASNIVNREFKDVLLDKNMQPLATSPIKDNDTSYLIINFAPAVVSERGYDTTTGPKNDLTYGVAENVLVNSFKSNVLDYTLSPLPRYIIVDNHSIFRFNANDYSYTSPTVNVYYRDHAKFLDKKLNAFYTAEDDKGWH